MAAKNTAGLTARGSGRPDYSQRLQGTVPVSLKTGSVEIMGTIGRLVYADRLGSVQNVGSLRYIQAGSIGRVERAGTLGRLVYANRLGSVQNLGSLRYVQAGTLGKVTRVGTQAWLNYANRLGTVQKLGSLRYIQAGTLGKVTRVGSLTRVNELGTLSARRTEGTVWSNRVHTAVGSTVVGAWIDVMKWRNKSLAFWNTLGGSLHVVTGFRGSGVNGATGTYYSQRLGAGTYTVLSLSETIFFIRPVTRSGSVAPGKGTLTVMLNLQA